MAYRVAGCRVPSPGQALYAASKAALTAYFGSLATEVADRGVRVTLVCPGPINSEGEGGSARSVYGTAGRVPLPAQPRSSKKVDMPRCTQLVCAAAAHGVDEAWIARHPVLLAGAHSRVQVTWIEWLLTSFVGA